MDTIRTDALHNVTVMTKDAASASTRIDLFAVPF